MAFDSDPVSIAIEIELQRSKQEVDELTRRVAELERQLKTGTKAKEDFTKQAAAAKSILEGLKGAVSAVSPELANLIGLAQRGAQGMEAMGKAAKEVGGMLMAGGAVAVAIAGATLLYTEFANELDRANKNLETQAKRADEARAAWGKLEADRAMQAYSKGEISYGEAVSRVAASGGVDSPATSGLVAQLATAQGYTGGDAPATGLQKVLKNLGFIQELPDDQTKVSMIEQLQTLIAASRGKDAAGAVGGVTEKLAKARAGAISDISWNPVDWSGGIRVETDRAQILAGIQGGRVDTSYPGYIAPQTLDPYAGQKSYGQQVLGGIGKGLGQYATRTAALAQGDMSGALAGLGPAGAIVGGLQTIGKMGAEGVGDQLDGIKDAMIGALEALPEILSEVIPEFAVGLATEFVPRLVESLPAIIKAAIVDLPLAIAQGIIGALNPWDRDPMSTSERASYASDRGYVTDKSGDVHGHAGSHPIARFQTGGRVPSDGLYWLEREEEVIPAMGAGVASSQGRAAKSSSMSFGGIHVHAEGAQLGRDWDRDLEDRLSRLFQRFGPGVTSINIGPQGGPVGDAR